MPDYEARPQGVAKVACPLGKCPHEHRFRETGYTINDPTTLAKRLEWLRLDHAAGHPQR